MSRGSTLPDLVRKPAVEKGFSAKCLQVLLLVINLQGLNYASSSISQYQKKVSKRKPETVTTVFILFEYFRCQGQTRGNYEDKLNFKGFLDLIF